MKFSIAKLVFGVSCLLSGGVGFGSDEFFREKIEPVLKQHCFECHSHDAGVMKGGLTLDSQSGWSEGGDSGPAIVPGKPNESLLIDAIRHESIAMPPKSKLDDSVIADFVTWIEQGAHDPRILQKKSVSNLTDWWSLKPLASPPLPEGASSNPVDRFISEKLAAKGLKFAPEADRATLIRRLTYDLHGLPPTPEEVEAFVIDPDEKAYERLVDRLLASPRYGERFTRHWLDIVHYGESNGFGMDRPRLTAWPYRDYLIQAFNEDKPYARFVQEQLAADALFPEEPQLIPALGFIAAGPFNQSALVEQTDGTECKKIALNLDRDDMLTNVSSTFLSVTLHCARCHQHKFDPISQKDYYRMQSVFAGVIRGEREYDPTPELKKEREYWQGLVRQFETDDFPESFSPTDLSRLRTTFAALQKTINEQASVWKTFVPVVLSRNPDMRHSTLKDQSLLFEGEAPKTDTYTLTVAIPEPQITGFRIEVLPDESLPKQGPGRLPGVGSFHLSEVEVIAAPLDAPAKPERFIIQTGMADFSQGGGFTPDSAFDGKSTTAWGIDSQEGKPHQIVFVLKRPIRHAAGALLTLRLEQNFADYHQIGRLRVSYCSTENMGELKVFSPQIENHLATVDPQGYAPDLSDPFQQALGKILVKEALVRMPPMQKVWAVGGKIPRLRNYYPPDEPYPIHVLTRGSINTPAAEVAPGALECVGGIPAEFTLQNPKEEAQRRAALANWIADSQNMLTWRSIANRMWCWHFGRGLSESMNDFGHMGTLPSHPELLDWLACELRGNGGSLKSLHRIILTSQTYRQVSVVPTHEAQGEGADPRLLDSDNRLLWKQNRRRLDAEQLRDSFLAVSGKIDLTMGGPSAMQFNYSDPDSSIIPRLDYNGFDPDSPSSFRRSVYRYLFRNQNDALLEAFDAVDPSLSTPRRNETITPLQSLSLFNNRFVLRQCEHLAARLEQATKVPEEQINRACLLLYGRSPEPAAREALVSYLSKFGLASTCRVLVNSNDFVFVN